MKWIKSLLTLVTIVLVFVWGILFASENVQLVALDLVVWQLPAARVSIWVVGGFAIGGILGLVMGLVMIARLKAQKLKVSRELARCQKELASLRSTAGALSTQ